MHQTKNNQDKKFVYLVLVVGLIGLRLYSCFLYTSNLETVERNGKGKGMADRQSVIKMVRGKVTRSPWFMHACIGLLLCCYNNTQWDDL